MQFSKESKPDRWVHIVPVEKTRFQAPRLVNEYSPIVRICQAILLEKELSARDEYEVALERLRATRIARTIRNAFHNSKGSRKVGFTLKKVEPILMPALSEKVWPVAIVFSDRWFFSGLLCAIQIGVMLTLDVIGIDVKGAEGDRIKGALWKLFYDRHTTQEMRYERGLLRGETRRAGWHLLSNEDEMKYAVAWIRWRHELEKSLAAYIRKEPLNENRHKAQQWDDGEFWNTRYKDWYRKVSLIDRMVKGKLSISI